MDFNKFKSKMNY